MRDIQLIGMAGIGDIAIDVATNKFYAAPSFAYKSDSSMLTSNARKLNLLCPPVPTKLLEIHMIVANVAGATTNPLNFKFHIVNFMTGAVTSTIPTTTPVVNPVTMPLGIWTPIFDVRYDQAPTILPGHYLQMEFVGYGGTAGAGNNYSCQAYWRLMVAS
jgi:hypothetical protein